MAKYNELEVTWKGQQVLFVTRGKAKPFDKEEAVAYLNARMQALQSSVGSTLESFLEEEGLLEELQKEESWSIPDERMRRVMFKRDLQNGLEFCAKKYGVSEEQIQQESLRIARRELKNA